MSHNARVTTGYHGLDNILDGLRIGDNVVLKVDSIADYRYFVTPFVKAALADRKKVIYMRFGDHEPLLEEATDGITVYQLEARRGFESFATRIHTIITEEGEGAFYVFDCLSELLSAWATDYMVGNFFRVTCPYLYELDTVAYFALIRDRHSYRTIERIRETTQVLIDVYNHGGHFHIHPLKVWQRRSPTMFLPHRKQGEEFIPLANSFEATNLLANLAENKDTAHRQLDHWHRLFLQAESISQDPAATEEQANMVKHICRHMIGREERILELARKHLSLKDLMAIKARVIGTGFIGGKAVGMLLARNILMQDPAFDWNGHLEAHDSFYVGSNVYYSYIVHNGWWKIFMKQKSSNGYYSAGAELRERMLQGTFPDPIREGFHKMLEYYGQYPIIVRSSSLLEDGFGNAFAGKYDSFFCVNQGSPEERLEQLEEAVRKIFASAMSEDALTYRRQRGLDQQDEQMALLIQRVSGAYRKHYYFPELAGVGVSYNTFVWDKDMDPKAGMLRLVLGLGTRAVDRVEGDYPRIVALDAPLKKPHKGFEDTRKFAQRDVDLLNVNDNTLQTVSLLSLAREGLDIPWQKYCVKDQEAMRRLGERGRKVQDMWLLTFDNLFSESTFPQLMQRMLKSLETAYNYPVDVEFTVNFTREGVPKIDVVQCRPLQTKGEQIQVQIPSNIAEEKTFFRSEGNFMGGNLSQEIKWFIWVEPAEYNRLPLNEKYEVARLVGRLNKRIADRTDSPTMLMGPGRWGTSTPSLGVPISFSEISNISVLAEVAFTSGDLMPELSFGSHFFQDLVETDIFYLALFPEHKSCFVNEDWRRSLPNALEGLMPASSRYKQVVKVYRAPEDGLQLMADVVSQQLVCFREG